MLGSFFRQIYDFLLPRTCLVCGRQLLAVEEDICVSCLADLPLTWFWIRPRNPMADRFNGSIEAPSYAWAAALFYYDDADSYSSITKALKYGRNFAAGRHFASMLGERLASSEQFRDVDTVIPVPLHWTRRFSRGYNQSSVIAAELARALPGAVLRDDVLKRVRSTRTQTKVGVESKVANVEGAFRCVRSFEASHVLLVDDVFTTGATAAACASALRAVLGPSVRISISTLAFVG